MRRARWAGLAGVVTAALLTQGCAALGGGRTGYHLTAFFPRAVAFYTGSRVKLMGVNVGKVSAVQLDGPRIKVRFSVNGDVPLPADVQAAIMPLSLIGERNLTLYPPWTAGKPRARDGDVIPLTRTRVPIEVDDILKTVTDLAHALNPSQVKDLIAGAAATFAGHGQDLNNTLEQVSGLTATLAQQDGVLLQAAANVHQLAATLNARQQQLGEVIDDFAQATGVLSDERQALTSFLSAVAQLAEQAHILLAPIAQQLPGDIAALTKVVLTIKVNAEGLAQFVQALDGTATVLQKAFDPTLNMVVLRINLTPSGLQSLAPLLGALGIKLPCLNAPGQTCK